MSHTPAGSARRGLIALSATGVIWGSIGIVVRLLQDRGVPTTAIAFWRLVCASVVLLVALGPRGIRLLHAHLRRPRRLLAVSLGSLAFQLLYFFAVREVGVAVATLVTLGLAPVLLTAAEASLARAWPPPRTGAVLLVAITGLALVTLAGGPGAHVAPRPALGLLEAVLSAVFYAASTLWSAPLSARVEPLAITFTTSVVGVILLLPVVVVTGFHVPQTTVSVSGVVWLGVATTAVAYGLFYTGLRSTPGSVAMILTLLEPVTAVVLAALVLDESFSLANGVGAGLLIGAVAVLYVRPRARPATDPV